MKSVPAIRETDIAREIVSDVAMDIGKELIAYIEQMYPQVFEQMNSGAKLSFRNHIYNDMMSVLKCRTEDDYRQWLERRKQNRRRLMKLVRAVRAMPNPP